jgi:F420-dependent oxidoreductase-like protein
MRFALMIEPQQGISYEEQLAVAQHAEAAGFEALFRSDHFQSFPGAPGRGTTDAWAVIAGLARETQTIRLGTLVSPVTFRHPGAFAKLVTTIDEMSRGRVEVALGAGWNEREHTQLGLTFPPLRDRMDLLEDQLAMLHGLWEEPDGWSYEGRQVRVNAAIFHPKPAARPRPPVIVGGTGGGRSLSLAARYADEYNMCAVDAAACEAAFRSLDEECAAVGRSPAEVHRSAMVPALVGTTKREFERRLRDQQEFNEEEPVQAASWRAQNPHWIAGTPDQAAAKAREYAASGCERLVLEIWLPRDLAMIDLLGHTLIGAL